MIQIVSMFTLSSLPGADRLHVVLSGVVPDCLRPAAPRAVNEVHDRRFDILWEARR